MSRLLENKSVLITGGTGSLGSAVVRRIANGEFGRPQAVTIFSRDELKQAVMRSQYKDTDYMQFVIGDVRDTESLIDVVREADIIIHAAALKRVETCEKFPDEALQTNYIGASNIVKLVKHTDNRVECVIGVSSDKGAKPLNVYGMTKALQEQRIIIANYECPGVRFSCVRYGNVMGSRGSVIPIWQEQVRKGEPVTVTDPGMTRFLITLDQAVDTIIACIETTAGAEVYVPYDLPAASIGDMARVIGNGGSNIKIIGRGRGEKTHETLVTEDEAARTIIRGDYYVVTEYQQDRPALPGEYISSEYVIDADALRELLVAEGVIKQQELRV